MNPRIGPIARFDVSVPVEDSENICGLIISHHIPVPRPHKLTNPA